MSFFRRKKKKQVETAKIKQEEELPRSRSLLASPELHRSARRVHLMDYLTKEEIEAVILLEESKNFWQWFRTEGEGFQE